MEEWESVRDWEVNNASEQLVEDSYDFLGRGLNIDEIKVDYLRYGLGGRTEVGFFVSDNRNKREEASEIADYLLDEGLKFRVFTSKTESSIPGESVELVGNYIFDPRSELDQLEKELGSILGDPGLEDYNPLRCKIK